VRVGLAIVMKLSTGLSSCPDIRYHARGHLSAHRNAKAEA
jgi:hypothetical protein